MLQRRRNCASHTSSSARVTSKSEGVAWRERSNAKQPYNKSAVGIVKETKSEAELIMRDASSVDVVGRGCEGPAGRKVKRRSLACPGAE